MHSRSHFFYTNRFSAVGFALLCGASQGQTAISPTQNQAQPSYSLRVTARSVPLDVVVTDRKGNPVHGLTKEMFTVTENGTAQALRNFREYTSSAPMHTQLPPMGANTYTNFPLSTVSSSATVLLLDTLNTPVADQAYVRDSILRYLKTMPTDSRVAIFTLSSRLRLLQGFTSDPMALHEALSGKQGRPAQSLLGGDDAAATVGAGVGDDALSVASSLSAFEGDTGVFQAQERLDITQEALTALGQFLVGIPGRKNVVWFSTSFPVGLTTGSVVATALTPDNPQDAAQREMTDALIRAQAAIYPVSAAGLDVQMLSSASQSDRSRNGNPGANATAALNLSQARAQNRIAAEKLAEATGGKATFDSNGLKQAIAQAQREGENYYSMDYTPSDSELDRKYRRIEVKLKGGPYQLRFRQGYYADPDQATSTSADPNAALIQAMAYGTPPATGIIFKAIVAPLETQPTTDDPANEAAGKIHGKRIRYAIDYAASLRAIALSRKDDGSRDAHVVFAAVAYGADGKVLNEATQDLSVNMKPQALAELAQTGMKYRQLLDLPVEPLTLRIGVFDPASKHLGTLEIRLKPHEALPAAPSADTKAPR